MLKAVIHMDQEDPQVLRTAIGNIKYFKKQAGADNEMCMVINHNAVSFFKKSNAKEHAQIISELASAGEVEFQDQEA